MKAVFENFTVEETEDGLTVTAKSGFVIRLRPTDFGKGTERAGVHVNVDSKAGTAAQVFANNRGTRAEVEVGRDGFTVMQKAGAVTFYPTREAA